MARYQQLNPLDYMFFVGNELRKRLGLPGINVQLLLELRGRLDLKGFERALAGLYRLYPVTGGRLERSVVSGRPRWRLDIEPDMRRAVRVARLSPATPEQLHLEGERLLRSELDLERGPLLQFRVFRGLVTGDVLALRWPHALMDARGGFTVLEELQRLYEEGVDPDSLESAADELRDDVGELIADFSSLQRTRMLFGSAHGGLPADWEDAHLGSGPVVNDARGLHYMVRCLSVEQVRRIHEASMRVCDSARIGNFVRACGIHALHQTISQPLPSHAGYSTMQLIDARRRRGRRKCTPVCRNFFSALPICIPQDVAPDRRATAKLISAATREMLSRGLVARRFAVLERLSRVPVGIMARIMEASLTADKRSMLGRGLGRAPSLPMGFMGGFSRPLPTFCGADWLNIYGAGAILPQEGFGLNLIPGNDPNRLNIMAAYYEPRVTRDVMGTFLDRFIESLLDAG